MQSFLPLQILTNLLLAGAMTKSGCLTNGSEDVLEVLAGQSCDTLHFLDPESAHPCQPVVEVAACAFLVTPGPEVSKEFLEIPRLADLKLQALQHPDYERFEKQCEARVFTSPGNRPRPYLLRAQGRLPLESCCAAVLRTVWCQGAASSAADCGREPDTASHTQGNSFRRPSDQL